MKIAIAIDMKGYKENIVSSALKLLHYFVLPLHLVFTHFFFGMFCNFTTVKSKLKHIDACPVEVLPIPLLPPSSPLKKALLFYSPPMLNTSPLHT